MNLKEDNIKKCGIVQYSIIYIINNIFIVMKEFSSTDEKIIKATFAILQREGFTKATTKKIAAEAGVNEVTIFRNFQNKNNLVEITRNAIFKGILKRWRRFSISMRMMKLKTIFKVILWEF